MIAKKKINRIAVIGLGLIGGSLAYSLSKAGYEVIGVTRNLQTLKLAKKNKVISKGYTKLSSTVLKNIDLVFIATPLHLITNYIKQIANLKLRNQIIITDVGSTKFEICNFAKNQLFPSQCFIGGHPMAGTEHSGFAALQKNLFKGAAWALTPIDKNKKSQHALKILSEVISKICARLIITTPEKHDKAVALISHMPILVAIGLCQLVQSLKDPKIKKLAITLASSGFRDMTRVASGNAEMSHSILKSNMNHLLKLSLDYCKEIQQVLRLLNKNPKKLLAELKTIRKWRRDL